MEESFSNLKLSLWFGVISGGRQCWPRTKSAFSAALTGLQSSTPLASPLQHSDLLSDNFDHHTSTAVGQTDTAV